MLIALGLIALSLGYRVFVLGGTEKNGAKLLGQVIGIFVMIAAIFLMLASFCPKSGKSLSSCGKYKAAALKTNCPLSQASSTAS